LTLDSEDLARNRADVIGDALSHPLDDEFHKARSPNWSKVKIPLLSSANWGGQGLHLRGNMEAFTRAASPQKWLEVHGGAHWTEYYTDYGVELQKLFFDHFLKGESNGWEKRPAVQLKIRHPGERFEVRLENEWPLARTQWTRVYLDLKERTLVNAPLSESSETNFAADGDGATFFGPPLDEPIEITGPSVAKLFVSSSTSDADLFVVLRVFSPDGDEITFQGAQDPRTLIAQGWLRASHRKLDPNLSLPYRPYHSHDEIQPLTPGHPVDLDIEIWPTCIVIPAGYRLAVTVRGKDYQHETPSHVPGVQYPLRGIGPFLHVNSENRPSEVFSGVTTLHSNKHDAPYLLLPIIPTKAKAS
jgi:hypothetical protein